MLWSADNALYVSMASLWECAIKSSIGKLVVPDELYGTSEQSPLRLFEALRTSRSQSLAIDSGALTGIVQRFHIVSFPTTTRFSASTYPTWKRVANLPMHHRDPFDRLLVAQTQLGGLIPITRDHDIAKYDVPTVTV